MNRPTMLLIMDGCGIAPEGPGNAVTTAKTPNLDRLWKEYPHTQIEASGKAVGLPAGQMGNSEVGHTNMGAGRVVWQELSKITNEIEEGSFFKNDVLLRAMEHVNKNNSTLHIFGLMSDGGVHSHIEHIKGIARMAKMNDIKQMYVHCFMDGRDTPPTSGAGYVKEMEDYLEQLGLGKVGLVSGRYYAMDRDKRWDRVQLAYEALTESALPGDTSGVEAVKAAYACEETDEFIKPRVCNGFDAIKSGDAIIFANFRPDRAREITRAFVDPDFESYGFKRGVVLSDLFYVCMTQYDVTIPNVEVAFKPQSLKNTLGEYISSLGLKQLRIAETEKYAHVTFFFNGGLEAPYEGEERILVDS
ncbi:MAG: 2,3-bisphosphoglycerate-independent phosphoglycerate mutase, partial [Firmicutes bacterium]|nr:2,3-bisphosphoglycerate-independent phosphoglycerate mutase [Bacillota bacterium]